MHKPFDFAKKFNECDCCEGLDPTLEACCARDLLEQRRTSALLRELRKVDPSTKIQRTRENVLGLSTRDTTTPLPVNEESEDDDTESSDSFGLSDSSLMERLRNAKILEIEAKRRVIQISNKDDFDLAIESNAVLVVLISDETSVATAVYHGLATLAAQQKYANCTFRKIGAVNLQESMDPGLAVYIDGSLAAFRTDLREFANEESAATDSIDTFLDRSGINSTLLRYHTKNSKQHLFDDEDSAELYFNCGMPGCRRTFEHNHITSGFGTSSDGQQSSSRSLPREWSVDHAPRDLLA